MLVKLLLYLGILFHQLAVLGSNLIKSVILQTIRNGRNEFFAVSVCDSQHYQAILDSCAIQMIQCDMLGIGR